ncbi:MAG TPA: sigma factor-like helix-turn-helix DNA-binding protein [Candidatus Sulfotelmatobacter sp.]|nr:sigma factor-like helix-turn-helix DNA-binding protein [Candidatus Sulfotelmatobacter sp.]
MNNSIFNNSSNFESLSENDDISVLNLPKRVENSLKNYNIYNIKQFCEYKQNDLFDIRNIGPLTLQYLIDVRKKLGISPIPFEDNRQNINNSSEINITTKPEVEISPVGFRLNDNVYWKDELIGVIKLPTRIENALVKSGIENLELFFKSPPNELTKIRNIGKNFKGIIINLQKSMEPIYKLEDLNNTINSFIDTEIKSSDSQLIDELINMSGNSRTSEIIKLRYGIITGDPATLEEIGNTYNITRERVRQIQKKALNKIQNISNTNKTKIISLLNYLFSLNDYILSAEEADDQMQNVFVNLVYDGSSILDLLVDLGWIQSFQEKDVILYSAVHDNFSLTNLMNEIIDILKSSSYELDLNSIFEKVVNKNIFEENNYKSIILKCCILNPQIYNVGSNKFTVYSNNNRSKQIWIDTIIRILKQDNVPLHWETITSKLNDEISNPEKHVSKRYIHYILISNPEFALTGKKGIYGLVEWGIRKASTQELIIEALKKAGHPLTWKQIYEYVHSYKDTNKNNIFALLANKDKFINRMGGYWYK